MEGGTTAKVGRNDPCYCGSGSKYKKCCGNPLRTETSRLGIPITAGFVRRVLRPTECADVAKSLRESLDYFQVRLPPGSDLDRMTNALAELGDSPPAGVTRSQRHARLIEQGSRIAAALSSLRGVGGIETKLKWLRKRLDRFQTQDAQALDALFELEIAGRLAQSRLAVRFEEPDIIVAVPGFGSIGLPCKRPRSPRGVEAALRDAKRQVSRSGSPGVAMVSLEALLHPPVTNVDGTKAVTLPTRWRARTKEEFDRFATDAFERMADDSLRHLELHCRGSQELLGVVWSGVVTADISMPPSYSRHWMALPAYNQTVAKAQGLVIRLARALHEGGPE